MKVRPRVVLLVRLVLACWILQETRNTYTASTWQMNGRSQLALFDYSVVAVDILPNRKNETVHVQHLKRKHPQTENSDDPSEPDYEFSSEYQQAETATIQQLPNFQLGLPDLAEMAKAHIEPVSNVTAAICFKTLFGDIDIGIVIQWAAYNRLLGFDHIYMWYRPEIVNAPRFSELQRLPFVTLTINTQGNRDNYYAQWKTESMCLGERKFAGKYDWVMVNDIDEYLWFTDHIGVKEFLSRQPAHFTYMSLPKRMYTLDHRTDFEAKNHKIDMTQLNEFAVSQYPFYVDDFCYHMGRNRGNPFCPTWRGRAKVIVRPRFHTKIDVHGNIANPNPENGTIHFSKDQARFMEWPAVFAKHNVTKRNTADFFVLEEDDVHIHNLARGFKADKNGMFRLQHDKDLKDWFHFVKGRFGNR